LEINNLTRRKKTKKQNKQFNAYKWKRGWNEKGERERMIQKEYEWINEWMNEWMNWWMNGWDILIDETFGNEYSGRRRKRGGVGGQGVRMRIKKLKNYIQHT